VPHLSSTLAFPVSTTVHRVNVPGLNLSACLTGIAKQQRNCRDLPYCSLPAPVSRYADPDHFNADPHSAFHSDASPDPPHPAFHFDADLDPDPAHHSDCNLRLQVYKPSSKAPMLVSSVGVHGSS
jgi:hypothetical protein